jgi:hypothetical protein
MLGRKAEDSPQGSQTEPGGATGRREQPWRKAARTLSTLTHLAKALKVGGRDFFQPGGDAMAQLTASDRKWNNEVEKMASKLEEVEEWAR